jgi:excisionase family DNA binding protein
VLIGGKELIGMNHDGHALLTLVEAAAYLRVHPRTMSRLLQQRLVPGVRIGRQWRVRKTDLDAYFTAAMRNDSAGPSDSPPNDDPSAS